VNTRILLLLLTVVATSATAQTYTAKPVRVVVAFAPGGTTDILGRLYSQKLSTATGQQFVVDNRAGAGGTIGTEAVVRATPDGYTINFGSTSSLAVSPKLYPDYPTIVESGIPGYDLAGWYGVVVPSSTPRPIIDRLHAELGKAMRTPDMAERYATLGVDPVESTPEQFDVYMRAKLAKWGDIIKRSGTKLD
jgi:tripartite-type tricarboxylate transporter receptor subunit TctC